MSKRKRKLKRTSTHGDFLGNIVFGIFEDESGAMSTHVWDRPGWDYRDYCALIPTFLQVLAEKDGIPISEVWECVSLAAQYLEEIRPTGYSSN